MTTLTEHPLLTVRETAERLAVSEDTTRRLIAAGELPAVQLGGKGASVRIDAERLEEWLRSHSVRRGGEAT